MQSGHPVFNLPAPIPLPVKIAAFPKLAPVRLEFPRPRVTDGRAIVAAQLDALQHQRVAVTAMTER